MTTSKPLATTEFLDQNRLDDFQAEKALEAGSRNNVRPGNGIGKCRGGLVRVSEDRLDELMYGLDQYNRHRFSGRTSVAKFIRRTIRELSPDEKRVIYQLFFNDLSIEEVAIYLRMTLAEVRLLRRSAINRLQKLIPD